MAAFAVAPKKTPKWLLTGTFGAKPGEHPGDVDAVQIEPPAEDAPEELVAMFKETSQRAGADDLWQEIAKRLRENDGVEQIFRYAIQGRNVWAEALRHLQVLHKDQAVGWFDLDGGLQQWATLYDVSFEQPMVVDGRKLFLMTDEMWDNAEYPPEVGGRTTSKEASDRVGGMKKRRRKASEASKANDYEDIDSAVEAAQSRFGATHLQRDGRGAAIFSPVEDGYEMRRAYVEKGFTHWPEEGAFVERLPNGAVEFDEAVFDPDAPPRQMPSPYPMHQQRRAAEAKKKKKKSAVAAKKSSTSTSTSTVAPTSTSTETSTKTSTQAHTSGNFTATVTGGAGAGATSVSIHTGGGPREAGEARGRPKEEHRDGFHLVYLPANQSWMIFMGRGKSSTWSRIAGPEPYSEMKRRFDAIIGEERELGGERKSSKASEAHACSCHKPASKRASARENPVVVSDGVPWVKTERNPDDFKKVAAIAKKYGTFDDPRQVYDLLSPYLMKQDQECFVVVLLDVHSKLRGVSEVHRGARSSVGVSTADVMKAVLDRGASGFLVVHNHPSGDATPSDADADLTEAFAEAAKTHEPDVTFLDHVVIGNGEFYSFTEGKKFKV